MDLLQVDKPQNLFWLGIGNCETKLFSLDSFEVIYGYDARDVLLASLSSGLNIEFSQVVLCDEVKDTEFYEYSIVGYSALSHSNVLSDLLPSLTTTSSQIVRTHDVAQFLHSVSEAKMNTLLIDILDLNLDILKRLESHKLLAKFDSVYVVYSQEALYKCSGSKVQILEMMLAAGFEFRMNIAESSLVNYLFFTKSLLKERYEDLKKKFTIEKQRYNKSLERIENVKKVNKARVRKSIRKVRDYIHDIEKSNNSIRNFVNRFFINYSHELDEVLNAGEEKSFKLNEFLGSLTEGLLGLNFLLSNYISSIDKKEREDFCAHLKNLIEKLYDEKFISFISANPELIHSFSQHVETLIFNLKDTLSSYDNHNGIDDYLLAGTISLIRKIHAVQTESLKLLGDQISVSRLKSIELGSAWAGNTVNTVIFRHEALVSTNDYQFGAFYASANTIRLFKRSFESNTIELFNLKGDFNVKDAHNSISLGLDLQDHLHISFDHHGSRLRYMRSLTPLCISEWGGEIPLTDNDAKKVTYPSFVKSTVRDKEFFMLLYRSGNHISGEIIQNIFNHDKCKWERCETPILSGINAGMHSANAYLNTPCVDRQGNIGLSYVWRTKSSNDEALVNNLNVSFACSQDLGQTWTSSKQRPLTLPISPTNGEVVHATGPETNLINQCAMTYDCLDRPHIVFYANDCNGIVQYKHLWFDGEKWSCSIISNRTEAFQLSGRGTLRLPISRPAVVCDDNNNIYVIYRGDFSNDKLALLPLKFPLYKYIPGSEVILDEQELGNSEPIIDRARWEKNRILSCYAQPCEQVDNEGVSDSVTSSTARLLEFKIDF